MVPRESELFISDESPELGLHRWSMVVDNNVVLDQEHYPLL